MKKESKINVPKSMNPLWGLKRLRRLPAGARAEVPKSMNPLWGLKQQFFCSTSPRFLVPKSMNPLWGLKPVRARCSRSWRCSQKHESSLGIETLLKIAVPHPTRRSQKHESSLGIETSQARGAISVQGVPKSMNPLWGLKRDDSEC